MTHEDRPTGGTGPPDGQGRPGDAVTAQQPAPSGTAASLALSVPVIDPDADALTAALAYAAAGWYVVPVKRGTKHPGSVLGETWQRKSSRDPEQIAAWWAGTDHGIALHCGRSGAVVFDVDHPSSVPEVLGAHLGAAPYQASRLDEPGRGHSVFAIPPGRVLGNGGGGLGTDWGQVRGLNAVIIAAPSYHCDGGEYRWIRTGPVPVLPEVIAELLPDVCAAEDAATDERVRAFLARHTQASRPELVHGWIRALEKAFETGSRHNGAVSVTVGALKEARAGLINAQDAVDTLGAMFTAAATRAPIGGEHQRAPAQARSEYASIVAWAVAQAEVADLDAVRRRTQQKMPDGAVLPAGPLEKCVTSRPVTQRGKAERAEALRGAHKVFKQWLGDSYDLDALDAVLAAAAVEQLGGDPVWLLLVSGSGNAKTETVQSLSGRARTHAVSTISSPGALLSATSKRDRASDASGGLLRQIGPRGVLVIKDVTSIVSMGREMRAEVLAALREIYDGQWIRTVGTDGGKTLSWQGRIAVLGAVTTAWDSAHTVVASMGDRFVLLRMDSTIGRTAAGKQAIGNTGKEITMRAQLACAVSDVLAGAATDPMGLNESDSDRLLAAADLVTLARTAVEFDYRGDVIDAHAPEMPTRFAKQLAQVVRGGIAVGMTKVDALRLATRCARDSMPPLRLAIIDYLAGNPGSTTSAVRKGVDKPRTTVDRQLQALHMLGVLQCSEGESMDARTRWCYSLAKDIDPHVLDVPPRTSPEKSVGAYAFRRTLAQHGVHADSLCAPSDKSGDIQGVRRGGT